MKRIISLLIFVFISVVGMSQIKTSGIFETGYINRRTVIYLNPEFQKNTGWFPMQTFGPFYGYMYLDAELRGFKVYTSNRTYFNKDSQIYFNPQVSEFTMGLSYTHKSIVTGYEHMCAHSIEAKTFSDFYDKVYIRVVLFGKTD